MKFSKDCTDKAVSIQSLRKRRDTVISVGMGIILAYVFLIALFIGTANDLGKNTSVSIFLGLGCTIVSVVLILGSEWQKVHVEIKKRS